MELPTNTAKRKSRVGKVVGNKMDKTVVVELIQHRRHRIYRKMERSTRRVLAHDEVNRCVLGDEVRIIESRPISRHKRWIVADVITKGHGEVTRPVDVESDAVVVTEPALAGDEA